METVFVRSPYNYDRDLVSEETGLACPLEESRTQQHQKDDADINVIIARFIKTGELPPNVRVPQYGDFTGISDYQGALEVVKMADSAFMALPAEVRQRFSNDPESFVNFVMDPANNAEIEKMGLTVPKAPEPTPQPAAEPPAAA